MWPTDDPVERLCEAAARAVPASSGSSYDVRAVVRDVVDDDELFELWPDHAANIVTGFATVDGRPVGVIANQPCVLAGTLDIEASSKAARFVQLCDAFNVPLLTFVDTPGFQPGKDLEWRGMIRHGAELVHAYAAATVPRVCIVLRKAYGGAYIVMDSRGMGNDHCVAWPDAEIAVMGAPGAVEILHGRRGDRRREAGAVGGRVLGPVLHPVGGCRARLRRRDRRRRSTPGPTWPPRCGPCGPSASDLPRRRHSNTPL